MSLPDNDTCPVCAFDRSSRGRPVSNRNQMICLDCGSRWKEVPTRADEQLPPVRSKPELPEFHNRLQPTGAGFDPRIADASAGTSDRKRALGGISGLIFALIFLLLAGLQFYPYLGLVRHHDVPGSIKISRVELEERSSPAGGKVFIVKGDLLNRSDQPQPVPKIAIILKKNNGNEVLRWYHVSPKPVLEAGQNLRFASSVFHPATFVAYAEASLSN